MVSRDAASIICQALGRGVTRSKRQAMQWMRKAAENGHTYACSQLATSMYREDPYARGVEHVGEAAGVATSVVVMEGYDVPPDVLTSVVHWLRKGEHNIADHFIDLRREALEGARYCRNEGCEVVGHLDAFKVCPQCKFARYWATRVRNKTGMRVGTRRHAAQQGGRSLGSRLIRLSKA